MIMTLTIQLPDELVRRLNEAAARSRIEPTDIVRDALESFLSDQPAGNGARPADAFSETEHAITPRPGSCLERAGDLVGSVEGPGDLSTNPKYMEDFGK
jgi:hypothetical protein